MKKILIILFLFCSNNNIFSDDTIDNQKDQWLYSLENPKNKNHLLLDSNFIDDYQKYDFSKVLKPQSDFLGYIGDDYRRIKIYFTDISKIFDKPNEYFVKGFSIVKNNKCDFNGIIRVIQIRKYAEIHYGIDEGCDIGIQSQGIAIAEYKFNENEQQRHSGFFEGIMTSSWYVSEHRLYYDFIEWYSDEYKNNQYLGTWTSYKTGISKVCNWGEYRIPFSRGLDIGAGEFSPNPRYYDNGWEDFKEIFSPESDE